VQVDSFDRCYNYYALICKQLLVALKTDRHGLILKLRWLSSVGCATTLAFAGILRFAPAVTGLASALTLTLVLTFARMFALFSISHSLKGDTCMAGRASGVGTNSEGPG
jgi:hypothetical protein